MKFINSVWLQVDHRGNYHNSSSIDGVLSNAMGLCYYGRPNYLRE